MEGKKMHNLRISEPPSKIVSMHFSICQSQFLCRKNEKVLILKWMGVSYILFNLQYILKYFYPIKNHSFSSFFLFLMVASRCHLFPGRHIHTDIQCVKERHSFERQSWAPLPKSGAKEECHSFLSKGAMWEWHSYFWEERKYERLSFSPLFFTFSYFFINTCLWANLYIHRKKGNFNVI